MQFIRCAIWYIGCNADVSSSQRLPSLWKRSRLMAPFSTDHTGGSLLYVARFVLREVAGRDAHSWQVGVSGEMFAFSPTDLLVFRTHGEHCTCRVTALDISWAGYGAVLTSLYGSKSDMVASLDLLEKVTRFVHYVWTRG